MDKIISNGTEVLIFSENKNNDSKEVYQGSYNK